MITRIAITAGILAFATLSGAQAVSAQNLRGFAGAGAMQDVNSEQFPAFGGGVLIDMGTRGSPRAPRGKPSSRGRTLAGAAQCSDRAM